MNNIKNIDKKNFLQTLFVYIFRDKINKSLTMYIFYNLGQHL